MVSLLDVTELTTVLPAVSVLVSRFCSNSLRT
jgi:hypothetical protein